MVRHDGSGEHVRDVWIEFDLAEVRPGLVNGTVYGLTIDFVETGQRFGSCTISSAETESPARILVGDGPWLTPTPGTQEWVVLVPSALRARLQ